MITIFRANGMTELLRRAMPFFKAGRIASCPGVPSDCCLKKELNRIQHSVVRLVTFEVVMGRSSGS